MMVCLTMVKFPIINFDSFGFSLVSVKMKESFSLVLVTTNNFNLVLV